MSKKKLTKVKTKPLTKNVKGRIEILKGAKVSSRARAAIKKANEIKAAEEKLEGQLGYKPRPGGKPKKAVPKASPVSSIEQRPQLTVTKLIEALKKIKNPNTAFVYIEGIVTWGQCCGLRLIDLEYNVLLEIRK